MRALLLTLIALLLGTSVADAQGRVRVRGYYRSDGTYVRPHYRSAPNHTRADNWSTRGNYNPYTGRAGTQPVYETNRPAARERNADYYAGLVRSHRTATAGRRSAPPSTASRRQRAGGWPQGSTARCRDGTYSWSRHRSGTCSSHGGVSRWRIQ
jgi:hypothetical protein